MPPKQRFTHRQQTIHDGFRTLGIADATVFEKCEGDRDAEFKVIKKCYHKACLQHHPDKGGSAEAFRDCHAAFGLLKDLHKGVKRSKKGDGWLFSECFQSASAAAVGGGDNDDNNGAASGEEEEFDMADYDAQFAKMATPSWEYYYEAAEESIPPYRVELAKSGRSKCSVPLRSSEKNCQVELYQETAKADEASECKDLVSKGAEPEIILKNEIRLGWLNKQSGGYNGWRHLRCFRVPHKVWLGLPDPNIIKDPNVFAAHLARMNDTILSGFEELPHTDQRALVEFCMDRNNWARPKKISGKIEAAAPPETDTDVKPDKAALSMAAASGADITLSSTTALSATLTRERFIIPKPGQNGASPATVFEGKIFVLTGTFPEIGGGMGLTQGKDRLKAMIESFGGVVRTAISGKTNVLMVGKEPGMSKVGKARARPKVIMTSIHDLRKGLDAGYEALEDFEVAKREEPMLIKDFSSGYQYQRNKEYNGLALTASKEELEVAMGVNPVDKKKVATDHTEVIAIEDDPEKFAASGKRKAIERKTGSSDGADTNHSAKATKKRKATNVKTDHGNASTVIVVAGNGKQTKAKKKTRAKKKSKSVKEEEDEAETADMITCDLCGANCSDSSYFLGALEEDYCPTCYEENKGSNSLNGAVYQRYGETVA